MNPSGWVPFCPPRVPFCHPGCRFGCRFATRVPFRVPFCIPDSPHDGLEKRGLGAKGAISTNTTHTLLIAGMRGMFLGLNKTAPLAPWGWSNGKQASRRNGG